ncbi:MAG: hypothetical protein HRU17_13765 [Polyangiaceae bacterium]|nr:hypothetical protein [Polyangiaceae bacterium]
MPALSAPLLGFLAGIVFAWLGSEELSRKSHTPLSRSLLVACLFGALVHGPIAGYFLGFSPDWAFAYAIDSSQLPSSAVIALAMLNTAVVPLGFLAARSGSRRRRVQTVVRIAAAPAAIGLIAVVTTLPRLGTNASYAQFHGDFGKAAVPGSSLGYAILIMGTIFVLGFAWSVHCIRRIQIALQDD